MTFETITGAVATTSTVVGGELTNKYSNFLNGGGSEVATVFDDDIFIVDPADTSKRIRLNADALSTSTDVICSVKSDNAVNLMCRNPRDLYTSRSNVYCDNKRSRLCN